MRARAVCNLKNRAAHRTAEPHRPNRTPAAGRSFARQHRGICANRMPCRIPATPRPRSRIRNLSRPCDPNLLRCPSFHSRSRGNTLRIPRSPQNNEHRECDEKEHNRTGANQQSNTIQPVTNALVASRVEVDALLQIAEFSFPDLL